MDIACGDGQRTYRRSASRQLHRGGVRTAEQQDFALIFYFFAFCNTAKLIYYLLRANNRGVLYFYCCTVTERTSHRLCGGSISRSRYVKAKGNVGCNSKRRRSRTSAANLLLNGKDVVNVVFRFFSPKALGNVQHNGAAYSVVKRSAAHSASHKPFQLGSQHEEITNRSLSLGASFAFCADIDIENVSLVVRRFNVVVGNYRSLNAFFRYHTAKSRRRK